MGGRVLAKRTSQWSAESPGSGPPVFTCQCAKVIAKGNTCQGNSQNRNRECYRLYRGLEHSGKRPKFNSGRQGGGEVVGESGGNPGILHPLPNPLKMSRYFWATPFCHHPSPGLAWGLFYHLLTPTTKKEKKRDNSKQPASLICE